MHWDYCSIAPRYIDGTATAVKYNTLLGTVQQREFYVFHYRQHNPNEHGDTSPKSTEVDILDKLNKSVQNLWDILY